MGEKISSFAVWKFHLALLRDAWRVLWHGFERILSIVAVIGILLLAISRPWGLTVLNWDISAWWVLCPVVALLIWGVMKANYQRFATLETENKELHEFTENLIVLRDIYAKRLKDAEPAIQLYDNWRHDQEQSAVLEPTRRVERMADALASDLRSLLDRQDRGIKAGSPLQAALLSHRNKNLLSADKILEKFKGEYLKEAFYLIDEAEAQGFDAENLRALCIKEPITIETIGKLAEASAALRIRAALKSGD